MISLLLAIAFAWSGFSDVVRCEPTSPPPTGYFAHGLTLTADGDGHVTHVAEVFPRGHRLNTSQRPVVHFYQTVSRKPDFSLDATRLWTAELANPVMPAAALVSPDGYFVTLGDWGRDLGERALVIYAADGRVVRTVTLEQLVLKPADVGMITSCGIPWRQGATYYFSRGAEPKLYIVTAWGPALELTLRTGALSRGALSDFATLRELVAQGAGIEPEDFSLTLRFSSITDMKSKG